MGIAGKLGTMHIAEILQWCKNGGQTGALALEREPIRKEVFFEKGKIVSAASNDPAEYLGQFLVARGSISEEQLTLAFDIQRRTRVLLGRIIVARRFLSEQEVQAALAEKILETIFNVFLWKDGNFRFHEKRITAGQRRVEVQLDVDRCILEGARRVDEWKRFRAVFPHDRLVVSLTEKSSPEAAGKPLKGKLLALAAREMSIEEICLEMRMNSFALLGLLCELKRGGFVAVSGERAARRSEAAQRPARKFATEEEEAAWLTAAHLPRGGVPTLLKGLTDLKELPLSPKEAFVITRINGRWDIASIVLICPIREIEALRILKSFLDRGIMRMAAAPSPG